MLVSYVFVQEHLALKGSLIWMYDLHVYRLNRYWFPLFNEKNTQLLRWVLLYIF